MLCSLACAHHVADSKLRHGVGRLLADERPVLVSEQEHYIVLRDRERIGRFDILPVTRDTVRRVHDRYYWGKRSEERGSATRDVSELEMYAKRNEERKGYGRRGIQSRAGGVYALCELSGRGDTGSTSTTHRRRTLTQDGRRGKWSNRHREALRAAYARELMLHFKAS